jgi:hypothetical protein
LVRVFPGQVPYPPGAAENPHGGRLSDISYIILVLVVLSPGFPGRNRLFSASTKYIIVALNYVPFSFFSTHGDFFPERGCFFEERETLL